LRKWGAGNEELVLENTATPNYLQRSVWLKNVPKAITNDALWSMEVYRMALLGADLAWLDIARLYTKPGTRELSDQLYRAVCSVSANIAEGYSRSSGKDRTRFYEYALGSSRESRDWYYKCRGILGDAIADHRIDLQAQIIRQLLTAIPRERDRTLKEDTR
jgi:four helix bundle protein